MKHYFILISILTSLFSFGQGPIQLTVESIPASCRLSHYQTGYGTVSVTASGGSGNYVYNWENLQNGATSSLTTWAFLNPGQYEITVTDDANNSASEIVLLDSVNPISSFDLISNQLSVIPDGYIGFNYANVNFINTSMNFSVPNFIQSDSIFYWNFDVLNASSNWEFVAHYNANLENTYYPGIYEVCLAVKNINSCRDTSCVNIGIFGPADIENETGELFYIKPDFNISSLVFSKIGFEEGLLLNIYAISGQQILSSKIQSDQEFIPFEQKRGTYIYQVIDTSTDKELGSGKLIF